MDIRLDTGFVAADRVADLNSTRLAVANNLSAQRAERSPIVVVMVPNKGWALDVRRFDLVAALNDDGECATLA